MSKHKHAIEAHYRRAVQLHASGRGGEAEAMYREVLAVAPAHADSIHMLGVVALQAGQPQAALDHFDQAIALRPRVATYYVNRANALHRLGRMAEAEVACGDALRVERNCAEAYQVLGHIKSDQGQAEDAIAAYQKAARIKPGLHDIHNSLGIAFRHAGRLEDAEHSLREALRREPGEPMLTANLSSVLKELGRVAEAERCLRAALQTKPNDPVLQYNLGLLLLLTGNFAEGWAGYDARARAGAVLFPPFRQARWMGEALAGRTLLVHAEQGLGATIQFSRYLPALTRQIGASGAVLFEAPPSLMRLLGSLEGAPALIVAGGTRPRFDLVCALQSLPRFVAESSDKLSAMVPYLAAEPERVADWRERLGQRHPDRRYRIGIAWSGNPDHPNDRNRSTPLSEWEALLTRPDCEFHAVQTEFRATDRELMSRLAQVTDHSRTLADFADTAALLSHMDLVISVDTAAAHLAGALGKPVWLVLPQSPDWRWMLDRTDTPWYPTMRLYRQQVRGQWAEVFARIAADIVGLRPGAAP